MIRILVAEDEENLGYLIKEALEKDSEFEIYWTKDGESAWSYFTNNNPQLCILDIMMPKMDGFALVKKIRNIHKTIPILILTARSQTNDVVQGFELGADDYLKKPFSIDELMVRIKSLLRRSMHKGLSDMTSAAALTFGKYKFYPSTQLLQCDSFRVTLTYRESELLKELVLHLNGLLDRKQVLQKLWGDDNYFNARTMDVYIAKLRKYLVHDSNITILNVRGFGYKLTVEPK